MPAMDAFTDPPADRDEPEAEQWRRLGFHDNLAGLVYVGERSHVIDYLQQLGWQVSGSGVEELFAANGFDHHDDEMAEKFAGFQYLSATLA